MTPELDQLDAEFVKSILDYSPATGVFRWRVRSPDTFAPSFYFSADHVANKWNSEFAGTIAGHVNRKGYRIIKINRRAFKASRLAWLIMTGAIPSTQIDHRNLNRSDNFFANLRQATPTQNVANRRALRSSISGIKGIYRHKYRGKWTGQWRAAIGIAGVNTHLGLFRCPAAAHIAYVIAATKVFGEFARTL